MKHMIPLGFTFCLLVPHGVAAEAIVFGTTQLTTDGIFGCRAAPACVASGNTVVLGSGAGAVTLTFTGVETTVPVSNEVVPVTLGTISASSASPTFPTRLNMQLPILRFTLVLTQSAPFADSSSRTLEYRPGGRTVLPFTMGTNNVQLDGGVDGYGAMVYTLNLPAVPMNGFSTITADAGVVPEPATLVLVGLGLAAAAARRRAWPDRLPSTRRQAHRRGRGPGASRRSFLSPPHRFRFPAATSGARLRHPNGNSRGPRHSLKEEAMKARLLLLALCAALVPSLALAQASGTGLVVGKVVDSSGGVLPGVTVTLKSAEAMGQSHRRDRHEGGVSGRQPAAGDLRGAGGAAGVPDLVAEVTVRLNTTVSLEFTLSIGSMSETVMVSGEAPTVDPERAGLAVNINNEALTSLPVSTPAPLPGHLGAGARGVRASRPGRHQPERQLARHLREQHEARWHGHHRPVRRRRVLGQLQLRRDPGHPGEDAGRRSRGRRGTGGFMTIVTKRGSNSLHGSAALFVIPDAFNSSNVTGVPANQRKDIQPDLTLGRPIMRDRSASSARIAGSRKTRRSTTRRSRASAAATRST